MIVLPSLLTQGSHLAPVPAATANLTLRPGNAGMDLKIEPSAGEYPGSVDLVAERPPFVTKEPVYAGKPRYGALRVGNGPRSTIAFAIVEGEGHDRIYVDANGNGDLTDDGKADWDKVLKERGGTYLERETALRASWGDALKETASADYSLLLYRRRGEPALHFARTAARSGRLSVGGKTYGVLLAENGGDALYTVPRKGDTTRRPVWLLVDTKGTGVYERFDLSESFALGGKRYEAFPSLDGARLDLLPAATLAPKAPVMRVLKRVGEVAPEFKVQDARGKPLRLSDFRGKTVILDFWATWCGPCQAAMPDVERIYRRFKGGKVVVLAVDVWDKKKLFDAWIKANAGSKYSFTFAYDPAESAMAKSVASGLYGVSGIPTTFVIDPEGRIAHVVSDWSREEAELIAALARLGIRR